MMLWDALSVSEWHRATVLAALDGCGSDPITTSYSGVGAVAWDDCCGQLTVTPQRVFRSDVFPSEYSGIEACSIGYVVVELLVSLTRCVPTPDDMGNPPSADALAAAHATILTDGMIVWQALAAEYPDEYEWERAYLRQSVSGGLGGCVAVETTLQVGVPDVTWCYDCG